MGRELVPMLPGVSRGILPPLPPERIRACTPAAGAARRRRARHRRPIPRPPCRRPARPPQPGTAAPDAPAADPCRPVPSQAMSACTV